MRPSTFARPALLLLVSAAAAAAAAGCSDGTDPGTAPALTFAVAPASVTDGAILSPPVTVSVRDADGNSVPGWGEEVSVSLEGGGPGVVLRGTTRRTPLAGLAIFDDLSVAGPGDGYRLVAHSGNLAVAESEAFDVHAIFRPATLTAGAAHTCALTGDGTAYCWGRNDNGALGTGDTEGRAAPTPVATTLRFASIVAFGDRTCALGAGGDAYCWGANDVGQLGDGTRDDRTTPQRVLLPGPARAIDAGYWHGCALLEDGRAFCWGDNWAGALGIGVADSVRATPVQVAGAHAWAKIETGYMQTCGLTDAGEAYCWGPNLYGENGIGSRDELHAPTTPVLGGHTFRDLVAGGGPCHGETCGITSGGELLCWGRNYQRTTGSTPGPSWLEPTAIMEDPGLSEVVVGPGMICGFTAAGQAYCLGDPPHRMLDPTEAPVPLAPALHIASLALGNTQTCAITTEGQAYCWGSNEDGQLGSGDASLGWDTPRGVWAP